MQTDFDSNQLENEMGTDFAALIRVIYKANGSLHE